ncbi:MAG: penicillin-binding protein 2 [Bacteroidales bacterium]|jgi:penicillin-binding protein 2|nr:penicillin-binding protein 2 [Bacteroidales bacterium]
MISTDYQNRKYVIIAVILLVGILFSIRLFMLQVLSNEYKLSAENNVLRYITEYPARGLIYDRNGKLLVYNEAAYDLMVVPRQLQVFDTIELCRLLKLDRDDFNARLEKAKHYSYHKPSLFLEQISREDYAFLEEKLYKYPGFYVQARTLRKYPYPVAAHLLGYIGEVNNRDLNTDEYYTQGDYIGKSGLEKSYEGVLRGSKGLRVVMVDVFNREKGSFAGGQYDTSAVGGQNLQVSLDAELQEYGELLMQNKIGSIVAIEPESGEILALVTAPAYDPNLLVGRVRSMNYRRLNNDSLKPLMNRAIMGTYPPGSTFKMVNALVGLQEGVLFPNTQYYCDGPESRPIRCTHYHETPLRLNAAIQHSCNPYFWNVFRSVITNPVYGHDSIGFKHWREHVISFGFGKRFNTDIPFELSGNIPSQNYYDNIYSPGHWRALTVRSLAIGQGEILITPLQLANMAATIANRGFYCKPHIIKSIGNRNNPYKDFVEQQQTSIAGEHFDFIRHAMLDVFEGEYGTARWFRVDSLLIGGKTGTVENPHGEDHSMFIAFAPYDNPKIALSVIVENSGFGTTWAAPIATLMIEKYLNKKTSRPWLEERMINGNLISKE